jgi:hypothetical protein
MSDCRNCLFDRGYCILQIKKENSWDPCEAFKKKIIPKLKGTKTLKEICD